MKLTPEERARFKDAAEEVYQAVGPDVWGDRTPSKAEFVDVIRDQIGNFPDRTELSEADVARFRALPFAEKRRIILEVGP